MIGQLAINNKLFSFNLNEGYEISIPLSRTEGLSSFSIPPAAYRDYEKDGFIGNKKRGGPCNLETITFTAHGNGTHTECFGHISKEPARVNECVHDKFMLAELISVDVKNRNKDQVLDFSNTDFHPIPGKEALIIRTRPNKADKLSRDYSGTNPPYILEEDMQRIVDHNFIHLLVDLPSVDKEWDGGKMAGHHIFWNYPNNPRIDSSITEFIYVEDFIKDGLYILKLNISNFESDAAPSRPVIYPFL